MDSASYLFVDHELPEDKAQTIQKAELSLTRSLGNTDALLEAVAVAQDYAVIEVDRHGHVLNASNAPLLEHYKDIVNVERPLLLTFQDIAVQAKFISLLTMKPCDTPQPTQVVMASPASTTVINFYHSNQGHWFSLRAREPGLLVTLHRKTTVWQPSAPTACAGRCQKLWKLTRTESRLSHLIASGRTVSEAAIILDITYQTARSHLKVIFSKTDSHSQNTLTRKMNTIC